MKADDKKKHFFCFQRELRREQRSSKASECGNNFFIFFLKREKFLLNRGFTEEWGEPPEVRSPHHQGVFQ
jgi:hypothetical protein